MVETKKCLKFYFSPKFLQNTSKKFQNEIFKELTDEGHEIYFDLQQHDAARAGYEIIKEEAIAE